MKVVIIDYGAGNVFSVTTALQRLGVQAVLSSDVRLIVRADRVIFPGVGQAAAAVKQLKDKGLDRIIPQLEMPVLGICLGMQLMCRFSEEENTWGLGIFPMEVKKFADSCKVPHMGWNTVRKLKTTLFQGINPGEWMYFVHSYYLEAADPSIVTATTEYGTLIHASVEKGNIFACQFHPEKSSRVGMKILQNFIEITQEFREKDKQGGR